MLPPLFFSVCLPTKLAIFWRTYLAPRRRVESHPHEGLSFLIVRLDGLGDLVLTTPLFRELKRTFPGSICTVVVPDAFRSLLVTNPNIDEIIGLRVRGPAWLRMRMRNLLSAWLLYRERLRVRHFDIAISPRWDVDDNLATFLCSLVDATDRMGYSEVASLAKRRQNCGFDAAFNRCLPAGPLQHETLRNLEIVNALGGKAADSGLEVRLTRCDREFASRLLANVPTSSTLIAVGIGGRRASRHWPLANYADTLANLAKEHHVQPLIICSLEEKEKARDLAQLLTGEAIVLSGAPLRKVCAVLERCDLFLGNDSGSAHLAGAMNCRTIVISRHPKNGDPNHPNSPVRFSPHCRVARVLQPSEGLDACKAGCLSAEPHCIRGVSVEQVVTAANAMLDAAPSSAVVIQANIAPPHDDDFCGLHKTTAVDVLQKAAAPDPGMNLTSSLT